ncbi:hypothetical protein AWM68_03490 [Fictibacillus phosphorivorans]|uniref:Uncharacterized protein n=1 Tax=Fictibacillus phosphorivorans TaxID=1221500 RepID=A0A161TSB6_9BACL|nr:hypothetical protein AWM68_03490 [Fictibacillus phosphorivorans]
MVMRFYSLFKGRNSFVRFMNGLKTGEMITFLQYSMSSNGAKYTGWIIIKKNGYEMVYGCRKGA